MQNQYTRKSSAQPWLVWSLCVLALGLLGWRGIAIYASPTATPSAHPLSGIVSAVVGQGNAQISETASGDMLILINGPAGPIDPAVAKRLTDITQTISPAGTTPTLKQFPFANQAGFNPTNAELAELSMLGVLASLTLFLAFYTRPVDTIVSGAEPSRSAGRLRSDSVRPAAPTEIPSPPFDASPTLSPIEGPPHQARSRTLVNAQAFAKSHPDVTANVIKRWVRARGFTE